MTLQKVWIYIALAIFMELVLFFNAQRAKKKGKISGTTTVIALSYKGMCFGITIITLIYLFKQSVLLGSLGILLLLTSTHAHMFFSIILSIPVAGYQMYKMWKAMAYLRSLKKFMDKQAKNPSKPEPWLSKSEKEWQERELEALKKRKEEGLS